MAISAPPSGMFSTSIAGAFSTGLTGTVGYRIINLATTATVAARTTAGITETPAASRNYMISNGPVPSSEGRYEILWDDGTNYYAEDLFVDRAISANGVPLFTSPGSQVTYTGPVAQSGDVTLVRGDDYTSADSRALEWTSETASDWPTLTGATIAFTVKSRSVGSSELIEAGSVVTATGASKKVRVELTAVETALAIGNDHAFDVQATLSSGRKVTLVCGKLVVLLDYSA